MMIINFSLSEYKFTLHREIRRKGRRNRRSMKRGKFLQNMDDVLVF